MPTPKSRARLWLFRLTAAVLAPMLFIVVLELVLALAGVGHPTRFVLEATIDGKRYHVANETFTWRFFPREIARSPVPFRVSDEKPTGTCRIFVFGGSAALGTPDHTFSFSRILEVLLREQYPGVNFEVVNAAVTAINSHVVYPIVQDCAELDADVFVVYMGNNEVVGPFGVGTVFAPLLESMDLIRTSLVARSTRTGQLIAGLASSGTEASRRREWRGLEMYLEKTVPADSQALQTVYAHFRQNLSDICQIAEDRGVPVLLSTVAVNLEECSPFASLHSPDLIEEKKNEWDQRFSRAVELESTGDPEKALPLYDAAALIDSRHAELHFRRGRCLRTLGQTEKAREAFEQARELDALRFRADSGINRVIKEVAGKREARSTHLVDVEERLTRLVEDGVPGREIFDDHVHFNFAGNYFVAKIFFEALQSSLPDWVQKNRNPVLAFPDEEYCARALGLTAWERVKVAGMVLNNLERPPFTNQLDNAERLVRLRAELQNLRKISDARVEADRASYRESIAKRAGDFWLQFNHGQFLRTKAGDLEGAETSFRALRRVLPDDLVLRKALAQVLLGRGETTESISILEAVIEKHPRDAEALIELGKAWTARGDLERAQLQFEKAVEARPDSARLRCTIAAISSEARQVQIAMRHYRDALELDPESLEAHRGLASLSSLLGQHGSAFEHHEKALALDPLDATTHNNLGNAHLRNDRLDRAVHHYRKAIELNPKFILARNNLGSALARQGKKVEAMAVLEETIKLSPDFVPARRSLGFFLYEMGEGDGARSHLNEVLRLDPNQPPLIYTTLAWLHAIGTSSEPADPPRALELARRAAAMTQGRDPQVLDALAGALAANQQFSESIATADRALQIADAAGKTQIAAQIQAHLERYRAGKAVE